MFELHRARQARTLPAPQSLPLNVSSLALHGIEDVTVAGKPLPINVVIVQYPRRDELTTSVSLVLVIGPLALVALSSGTDLMADQCDDP